MSESKKHEIQKIDVTLKEQLDELYNGSALTFEGVSLDKESINGLVEWLKEHSEISNPLPIYVIKGKFMNESYNLTGNNKYNEDLNIISIKLSDIKQVDAIIIPRFQVGGRWFDDIVDNNESREKNKMQVETKPKCALIGQDGNIFNLMGIASRTLKQNKMQEQAKEMCDRVTSSGSYEEALNIIGEYVDITDEKGLNDEEEWE